MRSTVLAPTLAMCLLLAVASMAIFTVAVFAAEAAPDIGVKATDIGLFTALIYVVAMFSGTVTGRFVGRYGAVRVTQLALAAVVAGMAVLTVATPAAAAVAAVALGACYGTLNPASAHILVRLSATRWQSLIFSVKQTGVPLGGAAAGLVVPVLVVAFGWRGASLGVAAVALVTMLALQPLRARFDDDRSARRRWTLAEIMAPLGRVFSDRLLCGFSLVGFAYAGVQVSVGAFFVVYLAEAHGMALVTAGVVLAFVQLGGIGGRLLWGAVADRLTAPRHVLAALGPLISVSILALTFAAPHLPFAVQVLLAVVLGACSFGWNGVFLSEVARLVGPGEAGDVTGGVQFIFYGGVVLMPPCFGVIAGSVGYDAAFGTLSLVALAAGLFVPVMFRNRPREG